MWDLIVSVPDHCLSFYFPMLELLLSSDIASESVITSCIKNDNTLVDKICKLLRNVMR